jgi:hypothetical protein
MKIGWRALALLVSGVVAVSWTLTTRAQTPSPRLFNGITTV